MYHLPYQAFRWRFVNIERYNERYQEHFFNDFLGSAHCTNTCDICIEHDSTYYSLIDFELSSFKDSKYEPENWKFRPFARDYKLDDQLFLCFTPAFTYHKCTHSCTLHFVHKTHFYCFSYKTMLIYAYYTNLTSHDKALYEKCHSFHNDLYSPIYGISHLRLFTILKLSIQELNIAWNSRTTHMHHTSDFVFQRL